jgi:hypothetical protein
MVEKRKADAVARRPARTTCENRFIEEILLRQFPGKAPLDWVSNEP